MARGRSTVGYLRRPGGRIPVQGGRTQEEEKALEKAYMGIVGGPRQDYIMRKRIWQAEFVHCREDGEEERASKRMCDSEAWGQELQEEEALIVKMIAAIDEGVRSAGSVGGGSDGGGLMEGVAAAIEDGVVKGVLSRKGLIKLLSGRGAAQVVRDESERAGVREDNLVSGKAGPSSSSARGGRAE